MKKTLSLILSVILILSVCVIPQVGFAAEGLSKTFSTADNADTLAGWNLPEGYVLSDADGITHGATLKKVIYKGGAFAGKFEYTVDFKLVYENAARVITNYIDDSNHYYIELNPKKNDITFKTFRRGIVSTHGTYELPFTIKANNLVTARVISNGGEGMSFYLKADGGEEVAIFENVYVKDFIAEGTVGYDAQANPLKANNFKVTILGEKDFVPPVEEEKPEEDVEVPDDVTEPEEEEEEEETPVEKVYDDSALKVITGLGIMDASALEDGKAEVSVDEFKQVLSKLKYEFNGDETKITLNTAIEYMVKVLGYDVMIGSRNNYYRQASSLKLLRGVNAKTSDTLIRYDLAEMLYNALHVEVLQNVTFGTEKVKYSTKNGQTMLTKILEMGMVEGQVTDNGVTAISGPSTVGQYHMVINGYEFFMHRDNYNRNDYIGRYVTAYYDDSNGAKKEIVYMDYYEREKTLVITPDTYAGYNANTFTYFDGNTTRTARISTGTAIYNGYYINTWNRAMFDNMSHGSITLVSDGGNTYTTMIIKDYKSVYINGIDGNTFYIYNKSYDGDGTTMDFEFLADDNASATSYVLVYDVEGNRIAFEDIAVGNVISVARDNAGRNIVEIIVSTEMVDGFEINEISYDADGNQIISDFTESYNVNVEYADAYDGKLFKPGDVATLYLDAFGYVSWADITGAQELYLGVLANCGMTLDMDANLKLAIYESDGEEQILCTSRKVRLLDATGTERNVTKQELLAVLAPEGTPINEVIVYTIDDNDFITSIQLPLNAPDRTKDNYLTKILEGTTPNYQNMSKSFGYNYFLASSPKLFAVEKVKKTDLEAYDMTSVSYDDANATFDAKCYSINGDSSVENVIDYAIIYESVTKSIVTNQKEAMVTSVTKILDEESGLELYKIVANNGSGVTLYAEPSVATAARSMATYSSLTPSRYTVKKGDIIKYRIDTRTGWIADLMIIFRSDDYYPETVVGTERVAVAQKGRVLDATLNYATVSPYNGNPLKVESGTFAPISASLDDSANASRTGGRRVFYGWVYDKYGDIIEVTNQDLSTGATFFNVGRQYSHTNLHPLYVNQFYRMSTYGNKVNVVYSNEGNEETINVSSGSASSIKSYKQAGRNCSRVLIMNSANETADYYMIILNNE